MKSTHSLLLLGLAAMVVASSSSFAASSVAVDLSSVVLQNGRSVNVSGTTALDPAHAYDYAITGTVHGTGRLASLIPPGTSIAEAVDVIQPNADSFLTGTVFDSLASFPFIAVNKRLHGVRHFGPFTLAAAATIRASIDGDGLPNFSLLRVAVLLNGRPDKADTLVFESGAQCTITVTPPPATSAQPDLVIIVPPNLGIGNDTYNNDTEFNTTAQQRTYHVPRGRANTVPLLIQNDGPNTDTIAFKGVQGGGHGFSIRYFDGSTDITAQAVSNSGYVISNLAAGDARLIRMQVAVRAGVHPGSSETDGVLVQSQSTPFLEDIAKVTTVAK